MNPLGASDREHLRHKPFEKFGTLEKIDSAFTENSHHTFSLSIWYSEFWVKQDHKTKFHLMAVY